MSRNARKWSGSLLAMTPSKSNTMARSTLAFDFFLLEPLARANRDLQAVFRRGVRAVVVRVVVAVRVIRAVEVEVVDPGAVAIEVEISPGGIGFRSCRQIAERHEQVIEVRRAAFDERRQLQRLAFQ